MPDTSSPDLEGHEPRECGEHRAVGPHRAWCYDRGERCYPEFPCVRRQDPIIRNADVGDGTGAGLSRSRIEEGR